MAAVTLAGQAGLAQVLYGPAVTPVFETELITDTAGHLKTGGTGRSCWGFNQSNLVRHGDQLYAMCWRDDLALVVFRRTGPGRWEASPPLPETPQNGVLLVDAGGRVHVIAGECASYHARFDPPGQVRTFTVSRVARADTRFGASIAPSGDILVAGGLPGMSWYRLAAGTGYQPAGAGCVPHPTLRAYYFVAFDGKAAHTYCYDDYFIEGTGYLTLRTYYYHNADVLARPSDWAMTVVSDVSDTLAGKSRGNTENEDLLVDRKGRAHLLYLVNRQPSATTWAGVGQDRAGDELYHAVGPAGGPFVHHRVGAFSRGRLYQTPDGRLHYLLTRGEWSNFELYYATGDEECGSPLSEPVRLPTPSPIDHIFVNSTRAGGTPSPEIDCYFTGPYPGRTNRVWYGRLQPPPVEGNAP